MPARSSSEDAVKVATRDQLFSGKVTLSGPVIAVSSVTFRSVTSNSAMSESVPSLTCTVTS